MTKGTEDYQREAAVFSNIPYIILGISIVFMVAAVWLTKILSNSVAKPVLALAVSTRKIAANDFDEPDLIIENKDEMGELVAAFNVMKHSTRGYIETMRKNNEMQELLYKEEMERSNMEKQLNSARLELLKSQINPHFLFNTLNMIACTAKLEDAGDTEKMILSLGNLFRYNLKNGCSSSNDPLSFFTAHCGKCDRPWYFQKGRGRYPPCAYLEKKSGPGPFSSRYRSWDE